jgi:hypothetical protein
VNANDIRRQEVNRLAEHPGFRLNSADAPSDDAETVDHRRVRICPHERIRKIDAVAFEHAFREIFQIYLVDDSDPRRDDAETVERLRSPFEKSVSLFVPPKLHLRISLVRAFASCVVDLDRVIDHEIDGYKRLDGSRIFAEAFHCRTHRGQIDEKRYAGEVLKNHPGNDERDLLGSLRHGRP